MHRLTAPATHGYPPFRGTPRFLDAATAHMHRRFGATVGPGGEAYFRVSLVASLDVLAEAIARLRDAGVRYARS